MDTPNHLYKGLLFDTPWPGAQVDLDPTSSTLENGSLTKTGRLVPIFWSTNWDSRSIEIQSHRVQIPPEMVERRYIRGIFRRPRLGPRKSSFWRSQHGVDQMELSCCKDCWISCASLHMAMGEASGLVVSTHETYASGDWIIPNKGWTYTDLIPPPGILDINMPMVDNQNYMKPWSNTNGTPWKALKRLIMILCPNTAQKLDSYKMLQA